jgi:hypothetical protein
MACLLCSQWSPKQSGQMARHGFALCLLGPRWEFLPPQHTCPRFSPASEEIQAARKVWNERRTQPK